VADASTVVTALIERGWTIAAGESVTAGLLTATLADVPGCSAVLRGAVVAYQVDVKQALLQVPEADLAAGVVSEPVALALARGAARVLGADVGIGTTGAAGPQSHDGTPAGTCWIAVTTPTGQHAQLLHLGGDRDDVRRQVVGACLDLLARVVAPTGE